MPFSTKFKNSIFYLTHPSKHIEIELNSSSIQWTHFCCWLFISKIRRGASHIFLKNLNKNLKMKHLESVSYFDIKVGKWNGFRPRARPRSGSPCSRMLCGRFTPMGRLFIRPFQQRSKRDGPHPPMAFSSFNHFPFTSRNRKKRLKIGNAHAMIDRHRFWKAKHFSLIIPISL